MCVAQYKRCELKMEAAGQTQRTLPALTLQCIWDINNELCFGCYDNGSFITFKPRRDTQLVRAAVSSRTRTCSHWISPSPPANYSPSCNTPRFAQQIHRRPPAAHEHKRLYQATLYQDINAITLLLACKHYPPMSSQTSISEALVWKLLKCTRQQKAARKLIIVVCFFFYILHQCVDY